MKHFDNVRQLFRRPSHNPSYFQIRAETGHQGALLDFCVPVNPYFPPPELVDRVHANLADILKYYPDYAEAHQNKVSSLIGVPAQNIVVSNGSTEIITSLCRDMRGPLVTPIPTFGRWTDLPGEFGIRAEFIQRNAERGFKLTIDEIVEAVARVQADVLVICNPDNPTGVALPSDGIRNLMERLRHLELVIIDESFIDFSSVESVARHAVRSANTVVVKSMGKALGWHGIRAGYCVANKKLAQKIRAKLPYWNVNGLASFVLKNTLDFRSEYQRSFQLASRDRDYMLRSLGEIDGMKTFPSNANFVYCELTGGITGPRLRDYLLDYHGIIIRECGNKLGSTPNHLRLAVLPKGATDHLVSALESAHEALGED